MSKAYSLFFKAAVVMFVVMMAAVFFWQPISMTFSNAPVTNDFVLQTAEGALDSKTLRGKVLALVFGHAACDEACGARLAKVASARDLLPAADRRQVMMILVSVNPEKDTAASIGGYARTIHPDFIGATGKPEDITALTEAFAVHVIKHDLPDGRQTIDVSPLTYLVGPDGRFVSVLNEMVGADKIASALRGQLPAVRPPEG